MIWAVLFQSIIAFGGLFTLVLVRFYRIHWIAHVEKVKLTYVNCLLGEASPAFRDPKLKTGSVLVVPWRDRELFRDLLIEVMNRFQGEERESLLILYQTGGFLESDIRKLYSKSFAQRVQAIARIESVRPKDCQKIIEPLTKDPVPLIRFAAIRFLVQNDPKNALVHSSDIKDMVHYRRYDVLLEILRFVASAKNSTFLTILRESTDEKVIDMCLSLVVKERLTEALPFVRYSVSLLQHKKQLNIPLLLMHIACLAIDATPENESIIEGLTRYPVPAVRAEAYRALVLVRPDQISEIIVRTMEDLAPEVIRIGQDEFLNDVRGRKVS